LNISAHKIVIRLQQMPVSAVGCLFTAHSVSWFIWQRSTTNCRLAHHQCISLLNLQRWVFRVMLEDIHLSVTVGKTGLKFFISEIPLGSTEIFW